MAPTLKSQRSYSDEELFSNLKDGIPITEELIQQVRKNAGDALYITGIRYCLIGNFTKGLPFLEKSAAKRFSPAQHHIGTMYYLGWGVSMDYQQAMEWFLKAVNNNEYADAQLSIGEMYQRGSGVSKNIHTAIEWYTKAADQELPSAEQRLAHIFEDEQEVKDLQKAANYYKRAYDRGYKHISTEIALLNKKGYFAQDSNSDIDQAQPMITINKSNSNTTGDQINNKINSSHNDTQDANEPFKARMQEETAEKELLKNRLAELEERISVVQQDKIEKERQMQQKMDEMRQAKSEMENQIKELKETLKQHTITLDNNPSLDYSSYQSFI